jgi:cytoskeleton protein RodZ
LTGQVLTGVGVELKRAREAAGLAIDSVAYKLKLLPRQIESLEHERFDRLPGPAIARGMVRSYARLLELDAEPLVERMAPRAEEAPDRGQIAGRHREPLPDGKPRSKLLYAGFSVVLLALIGALVYEWRQEKAAPEIAAPVEPPQAQPAAVTQAAPPAVPEAPPAAGEKPPAEPVEQPAASEKSHVAKAADKPKPEAAAQPTLAPGSHHLVLRMEEEAWLEVRDSAGRSLVASLNPAGSERALRGQPPFELVVGNANHVKLTYDGKPVDLKPHIKGEVARFTLQ